LTNSLPELPYVEYNTETRFPHLWQKMKFCKTCSTLVITPVSDLTALTVGQYSPDVDHND
jgi:hypothetical protein